MRAICRARRPRTDSVLVRLGKGFVAGVIASTGNIPFDVAKSRIQGPQPPTGRKYHSCTGTLLTVYREEGFLALYKGWLPKVTPVHGARNRADHRVGAHRSPGCVAGRFCGLGPAAPSCWWCTTTSRHCCSDGLSR